MGLILYFDIQFFSLGHLTSVHPKTPNFGFTLSAVSTQLSAKVL